MKRVLSYALIAIAALLTAGSAPAHHSFAMFDQSKTVTIQGTVKDFRWTNPHVFIQIMVKNDAGAEHLARVGWKPVTLKPGDKITLNIHPMHDGSNGGQYLSGIGPDGQALIGAPTPSQGQAK